jgi:hypothetical protein
VITTQPTATQEPAMPTTVHSPVAHLDSADLPPDLDRIYLTSGAHTHRDDGVCLLEAVAWFAGEPHSDSPVCVSPVLTEFGHELNDALPDGKRQRLTPLIPRLVGTAGDGRDEQRGYAALDWFIRVYTPVWSDLAGLTGEAQALRDLRRIADSSTAQAAEPVLRETRGKADAIQAAWGAWGAATQATRAAARAARAIAGNAAARATTAGVAVATLGAVATRDAATGDRLEDSAIVLYAAMVHPDDPAALDAVTARLAAGR